MKRILSSSKNKNICVECKGTNICEYNKCYSYYVECKDRSIYSSIKN